MEPQAVRKTYPDQLHPTPEQERQLEGVLWRCRARYTTAREQRKAWWGRGQGRSATYLQQKAELPDLKAACPAYAAINAHVLQDVIVRVERAYHACFRRLQDGETPGHPRFPGRSRSNSFTSPQ